MRGAAQPGLGFGEGESVGAGEVVDGAAGADESSGFGFVGGVRDGGVEAGFEVPGAFEF
ncbi:hypothetical protein [Corynebacterium sp. Marseille-Q2516]